MSKILTKKLTIPNFAGQWREEEPDALATMVQLINGCWMSNHRFIIHACLPQGNLDREKMNMGCNSEVHPTTMEESKEREVGQVQGAWTVLPTAWGINPTRHRAQATKYNNTNLETLHLTVKNLMARVAGPAYRFTKGTLLRYPKRCSGELWR